jgi:hypothetical protein
MVRFALFLMLALHFYMSLSQEAAQTGFNPRRPPLPRPAQPPRPFAAPTAARFPLISGLFARQPATRLRPDVPAQQQSLQPQQQQQPLQPQHQQQQQQQQQQQPQLQQTWGEDDFQPVPKIPFQTAAAAAAVGGEQQQQLLPLPPRPRGEPVAVQLPMQGDSWDLTWLMVISSILYHYRHIFLFSSDSEDAGIAVEGDSSKSGRGMTGFDAVESLRHPDRHLFE